MRGDRSARLDRSDSRRRALPLRVLVAVLACLPLGAACSALISSELSDKPEEVETAASTSGPGAGGFAVNGGEGGAVGGIGGAAPCGGRCLENACCDGVCVDITTDLDHCGGCSTVCNPAAEAC